MDVCKAAGIAMEFGASVANPLHSARSEQARLNRHYFESVAVVRYVDENCITYE